MKELWVFSFLMLFAVGAEAQNTFPSSGNVGIGTTSPSRSLEVGSGIPSSVDTTNITIAGQGGIAAANSSGRALFLNMTDTPFSGEAEMGAYNYSQSTWIPLHINGSKIILGDPSRGGGNIGIGTASPTQALSVNGSISTGGPGTGVYLRDATTDGNRNTNVTPLLLHEGLTSGNPAIGWGLHLGAIPWTWGQDPIYYHAGIHIFLTVNGNSPEAEAMRITPDGKMGLGTSGPGAKLEVNGNVKLTSGSGASITFADGTTQSTAWSGTLCGGDYAESVDVTGVRSQYEPGDVMVIDSTHPGNFLKSSMPYSRLVAGIYSTKPGMIGRRQTSDPKASSNEIPMAMVGIVPTKVTTENGSIEVGDLMVTSSLPGYAMKGSEGAIRTGSVIGKALGSIYSGTGVVEVLVSLQ